MRFRLVSSKARERAVELIGKSRGYIDNLEVLDEFIAMCKQQRLNPVVWKKDAKGKIIEYNLTDLICLRNSAAGTAKDLRPDK